MSYFSHGFNFGFLQGMLNSIPNFGCFGYFNECNICDYASFPPSFNIFNSDVPSYSTDGLSSFIPILPEIPPNTNIFNSSYFSQQSSTTMLDTFNYSSSANTFANFNNYNFNFNNFSKFNNLNSWRSFPTYFNNTTSNTSSVSRNNSKRTSQTAKHWTNMTDEEMIRTYGNYNRDITVPYKGTAADLNKFLNRNSNSVLKNKGSAFIAAQNKYGINALVLIAICGQETAYGTVGNANKGYNVANIEKPKGASYSGRWRKFNSPEECIMELARLLKENYVTNSGKSGVHLKKLYQVNAKYCPAAETSSNSTWAKKVESNIATITKCIS